ncbi:hypothetical protein CDAR_47701 [Caerostris darwini]|uniref:Uncharacterized protein n=1 Tax=Caerostris darwini TaxID=1538125 RepID=A0AAV4M997_9ARAC|nr:hypothetical protein CDAR_47701 [Caerostris darwini]
MRSITPKSPLLLKIVVKRFIHIVTIDNEIVKPQRCHKATFPKSFSSFTSSSAPQTKVKGTHAEFYESSESFQTGVISFESSFIIFNQTRVSHFPHFIKQI